MALTSAIGVRVALLCTGRVIRTCVQLGRRSILVSVEVEGGSGNYPEVDLYSLIA